MFVRLHDGHTLNVHFDRDARNHRAVHLFTLVTDVLLGPAYRSFRIARRVHVNILEHGISVNAQSTIECAMS